MELDAPAGILRTIVRIVPTDSHDRLDFSSQLCVPVVSWNDRRGIDSRCRIV